MSQRSVKNIQFCCHKRRWETSRCFPDLFSWTSCEKQAVLFLLTRLETSISSKFSWKMSHLYQVCCWKCSSSLSKISEYFTTNTAGKCLDVSSKTSSGFRLINVETLSEQRSLACHVSHHHQPVDIKVILQTREADTTRSARLHLQNSAELCVSY